MHGTSDITFANAQQANAAYIYQKAKEKLYKTNTAVLFNMSVLDVC